MGTEGERAVQRRKFKVEVGERRIGAGGCPETIGASAETLTDAGVGLGAEVAGRRGDRRKRRAAYVHKTW